ncbi:MAG: transcriptional regulator [Anaerolineales bacterium]|jgi:DNA-binding MarR family transcriptional regulator
MSGETGNLEPLRDLADIDRLVHEPARLMLMMYLYNVDAADFVFLVNATGLTWGNLSSHLSKLEEAGYVEIEKGYVGKKPHTMARLTDEGRAALDGYRRTMRDALKSN